MGFASLGLCVWPGALSQATWTAGQSIVGPLAGRVSWEKPEVRAVVSFAHSSWKCLCRVWPSLGPAPEGSQSWVVGGCRWSSSNWPHPQAPAPGLSMAVFVPGSDSDVAHHVAAWPAGNKDPALPQAGGRGRARDHVGGRRSAWPCCSPPSGTTSSGCLHF